MKYLYLSLVFSLLASWSPLKAASLENYQDVLKQIDSQGRVNYGSLKKSPEPLNEFIKYLDQTRPGSFESPNDRLAFLINAYNAFAISGVVKRYPIKSVKPNPLDSSFFSRADYRLGGKAISLDQLESQIRSFRDPRIHFVIVCASKSCPRLRNVAYEGAKLNAQLESAAREFANNPKHVSISEKSVSVNPILKWYKSDFGETIGYLNKYREEKISPDLRVNFKSYDWSLNQQ